jgi:hypothetical protein
MSMNFFIFLSPTDSLIAGMALHAWLIYKGRSEKYWFQLRLKPFPTSGGLNNLTFGCRAILGVPIFRQEK